ncbi:hypothetical protein FRB94_002306 [Tulasnella sp. JGI-2019a]|nr:hypothetical protein FRB93_004446 [Tulasnella sp. JGI-2019a]KAG9004565.1 hypothetical protein FRB94_002306 [Tulasnella sp. JGI-2019a]
MSVLVQRPQQVPGLISIQRQHTKPISSPSRRANQSNHAPVASPRQNRNKNNRQLAAAASVTEPTPSVLQTRSSKRRNNINVNSVSLSSPSSATFASTTVSSINESKFNSASTTPSSTISTPTPTTPILPNQRSSPAPRKQNRTAPTTPNRSTAPNRRNRSPEIGQAPVTPALNTFPSIPATPSSSVKRTGRNINGGVTIPATPEATTVSAANLNTWQQPIAPFKGSSMSTPASPAVGFPAPVFAAPPFPSLLAGTTFPVRRPATAHQRAPSHPTFPMHRENSEPFFSGNSSLEALFNAAVDLNDEPVIARQSAATHQRGVSTSASVPMGMGIHARMAAATAAQSESPRQRTLTGGSPNGPGGRGFAGASFQHAPDAMSMPKPFGGVKLGGGLASGRFGALASGSSSSSSLSLSSGSDSEARAGVVDLSEEDESEDEVFFA